MPVTNGRPAATERTLADGHLKMLQASAISEEVALARGYWTATKRSELRDLGFASVQQLVPALVVPIGASTGEIVNYQARPDTPEDRPRTRTRDQIRNGRRIQHSAGRPPPCRA